MDVDPQDVLNFVVSFLTSNLKPKKIILYGSRARQDHTRVSDYDIAVVGVQNPKDWAKTVLDLQEKLPTLNKLDIINYDFAGQKLQARIDREGKVIYEAE